MMKLRTFASRIGLAVFAAVACQAAMAQQPTLNLYSARHYQTDEALYGLFTKNTGVAINRIESDDTGIVNRLKSEGAASPADVVLLASGTATLETMLAKRAIVVGYKISPLTYRIVKLFGLLKVERYALPNVLAGEDLAPELMQDDCTPEKLAAALLHWFQHPEAVAALQPKYLQLHHALRQDASARAADAVAELLVEPGSGRREG